MPEEMKMDASKVGELLDKTLASLDSLHKRMDAMEEEKKADAAKRDADKEEGKKFKAEKADDDLEEGKLPGEPKPVVADKAKKDSEEKTKKDSEEKAKKDEDDEEAMADEDDEEVKKDAEEKIMADAMNHIQRRIADVEKALPKQLSDKDYADMADAQAHADSVFQAFGDSAPRPLQGENLSSYKLRLARQLQKHSDRAKGVNLTAIHDETAREVFYEMIYTDAQRAALKPADLGPGELRAVPRRDPYTGVTTTTFVGNGTFIGQMKRRPSRAKLLLSNRG